MALKGIYTALVTPFKDASVDETRPQGIDRVSLASSVDGIVPCGTTGEHRRFHTRSMKES